MTDERLEARKFTVYGSILAVIVVLDIATKYVVERSLNLYEPVPVIGDFFRLTYIFNRGAAFGLSLGDYSRYFFLTLTVVALVVLFLWFRSTPPSDRLRLFAIAAVSGGAIGNLIDRVRHEYGVVDFFDFGFGNLRWPVFNIADIAVTIGALLLAVSLWKEEAEVGREAT
jgi:signal peptidase II